MYRKSVLALALLTTVATASCGKESAPTVGAKETTATAQSSTWTGGLLGQGAEGGSPSAVPCIVIPPGRVSEQPTENDRMFIDGQVPHHQQMVVLADQAIARTTNAELREMAKKMKETQLKEIAEMKSWRAEWFGSPETPPMHADMIPEIWPGKDFDARWSEVVNFHHMGAIARAQQVLVNPARPETVELAKSNIKMQTEEIEMLEKFYMRVTEAECVDFEDFYRDWDPHKICPPNDPMHRNDKAR